MKVNVGNMRLKISDFNLRQNKSTNATAISSRNINWPSKMSWNILKSNSITLTNQRSVLVKRQCSADCSSAELVEQLRAVAQLRCPETLLPSLVQASRWQGFGDTAHPSPQCTPREGPARSSSSMTQHSKRWKNGRENWSNLPEYFQSTNIGVAALKEPFSHWWRP